MIPTSRTMALNSRWTTAAAVLVALIGLAGRQVHHEETTNGDLNVERRMADSYCELLLPFRDSKVLLEEYAAFYGGIR